MFENMYFTFFSDFTHTFFQLTCKKRKKSLAEVKKCSPESVKMISQLRFGFTLNFLSCVIYVFLLL